jgi:hypothetical protein
MIVNLIWAVVGLVFAAQTDCSANTYFLLSFINIGLFLGFFVVMVIAGLYYFISRRNSYGSSGSQI